MRPRLNAVPAICTICLLASNGPVSGLEYDGYYNYVGDHPDEENLVYSSNVQGITHDDDSWFISRSPSDHLYKIPVTSDLANPTVTLDVTPASSGVAALGYDQFKAVNNYFNPFDEKWYILQCVQTDADGGRAGLAFFDGDLVLQDVAHVPQQAYIGWCAVDPRGFVYTSENLTGYLNCYSVDWEALANGGSASIAHTGTVPILTEDGSPLLVDHMQGGDFAPGGAKLYLTTGFFNTSSAPHGIHVMDTTSGAGGPFQRVRKSAQSGLFEYHYSPTCGVQGCEEPEGLTFWDVAGLGAPGIEGELHVLLLDNETFTSDDVYLKHYSNRIYVDASHTGPFRGDPGAPDQSLVTALSRAVDDMRIHFAPGNYPGAITISKRVALETSAGGPVIIGQ